METVKRFVWVRLEIPDTKPPPIPFVNHLAYASRTDYENHNPILSLHQGALGWRMYPHSEQGKFYTVYNGESLDGAHFAAEEKYLQLGLGGGI